MNGTTSAVAESHHTGTKQVGRTWPRRPRHFEVEEAQALRGGDWPVEGALGTGLGILWGAEPVGNTHQLAQVHVLADASTSN